MSVFAYFTLGDSFDDKNKKALSIILIIYLVIDFIQLILLIILIIGIVLAYKYKSDMEIIEGNINHESPQNFFENPQKSILLYSFILLVVSTLASFITEIIFAINFCDGDDLNMAIPMVCFGGILVLFYIITFMVSQTCLKNNFFSKLLAKPSRLNLLFISFVAFYALYITFELINGTECFADLRSKDLFFFTISLLVYPLAQFVLVILLIVGFCLAHKEKHDIIDNKTLLTH